MAIKLSLAKANASGGGSAETADAEAAEARREAERAAPGKPPGGPWIWVLLREAKPYSLGILGFSVAANVLLLVSPLYMLQIYDRVMTSGSADTLIWLTALAIFLLGIYGAAEAGRRRLSALAATDIETRYAPRAFDRFAREPDGGRTFHGDLQALSRVQQLWQNGALIPFFDVPFVPFFIAVMFLIHPVIGLFGLAGAVLILCVAVAAEISSRGAGRLAAGADAAASEFALHMSRQRSAVAAMGLVGRAFARWRGKRMAAWGFGLAAARSDGQYAAMSRAIRQALQVLVLAFAAALALAQQISPGAIVAASIVLGRALGPIDQIVGGWRGLMQARGAWTDARTRLSAAERESFVPLPRPEARLKIDKLAVRTPGSSGFLIRPFSLEVTPGQLVALAGPNGSGKTSLLQTLAGAWPPASGAVAFGGRDMHAWAAEDRGRHVGYMPQDVELLPATVAENICRLAKVDDEETRAELLRAAKASGAHSAILAMADSYDTKIGGGADPLSAGQRQLVGLARALFGDPALILLDEPSANLDPGAAETIGRAIRAACKRGSAAIVATHDLRLVRLADLVVEVRGGAVNAMQPEVYLGLGARAAGAAAGTPAAKTADAGTEAAG